MSERTPFFTGNEKKSAPVGLDVAAGVEVAKKTHVMAKSQEYPDVFISSTSGFGFPGIPFVPGEPNPSVFCQGEDAQFDALLVYQGKPVLPEKYNLVVFVKTALRNPNILWQGVLDNGLYLEDQEGRYTVWIPAYKTAEWLAGSYVLNISLFESVGKGQGPHDKKISLIDVMFNIEYCGGSPAPESFIKSEDGPRRENLEKTWPNSPDTVRG